MKLPSWLRFAEWKHPVWIEFGEKAAPVEGGFGRIFPWLHYWSVNEIYFDPDGRYSADGMFAYGYTIRERTAEQRMDQAMTEMEEAIELRLFVANDPDGDPRGN